MTAFTTCSGVSVCLEEPSSETIFIADIAFHLSRIPRWCGKARRFYSVAEHSIRVSELVSPEMRLSALMHDASEYVLGDVSSPLKTLLPDYRALERTWTAMIQNRFGFVDYPEVHEADRAMALFERRALFEGFTQADGLSVKIIVTEQRQDDCGLVLDAFLAAFALYGGKRI